MSSNYSNIFSPDPHTQSQMDPDALRYGRIGPRLCESVGLERIYSIAAGRRARLEKHGSRDLKLCWNWLNKQVTAPKKGRKARENAMHSPGSRWEFRECTVAYFGFCACIPMVRIVSKLSVRASARGLLFRDPDHLTAGEILYRLPRWDVTRQGHNQWDEILSYLNFGVDVCDFFLSRAHITQLFPYCQFLEQQIMCRLQESHQWRYCGTPYMP